jgi:DNA-binding protein HU-beta
MLKSELIEELAARCGITATDSERFLNTLLRLIYQELKDDGEVLLSGFGKFSVSHREAREGINPQTLKRMMLPKLNTPKFVAGSEFKREVKRRTK